MIVTFNRQHCSICDKRRYHEVMHGLAKCVRCSYVDSVRHEPVGLAAYEDGLRQIVY